MGCLRHDCQAIVSQGLVGVGIATPPEKGPTNVILFADSCFSKKMSLSLSIKILLAAHTALRDAEGQFILLTSSRNQSPKGMCHSPWHPAFGDG